MPPGEPTLKLRDSDLDWRLVDDAVIALDGARSRFLGTNKTGAVLWTMLGDGTTRTALVNRLQTEFGVSADAAGRDIDAFLAAAVARDLIA